MLGAHARERGGHHLECQCDALWSESVGLHERSGPAFAATRRPRVGTVGHNAFRANFSIAFGGFGLSGIGREKSMESVVPFTKAKTAILDGLAGVIG
jgi:acyl-CoA reductase-like NAD-dependent aldehyde dehydrogenase